MEARPNARARLLEFAEQYQQLADATLAKTKQELARNEITEPTEPKR
jgi:hypothetical protein